MLTPCPYCQRVTYFNDGVEPSGCTACGAGECRRVLGRYDFAGPYHCGKPTPPEELICSDCCAELDAESQREHEHAHAAGWR